jgi:Protein of unknown function (DUF3833)
MKTKLRNKLTHWLAYGALLGASLMSGCASPKPADYAQENPKLDLKEYFNGTVDAWGIFQDRSGKVVKRFSVVMKCHWEGNIGTLDEQFTYSDGTTQQRIWTLTKNGDTYTGTAADVVGQAQGEAAGNAFHWNYVLSLPVDDKVYDVQMNDWMYLMDKQTMLNRAQMSKFGLHVGDLLLSFTKRQ